MSGVCFLPFLYLAPQRFEVTVSDPVFSSSKGHLSVSEGVTEQRGGGSFTINYYRKDSPFLSLEVPSPTPTC